MLKNDWRHPSLQFKKVPAGWSVRVNLGYRALATKVVTAEGIVFVWKWIGTHREYDELLKRGPLDG